VQRPFEKDLRGRLRRTVYVCRGTAVAEEEMAKWFEPHTTFN
jgi:hypothetical protein